MEKHEFQPKEWVLVRDEDRDTWKLDIFSHFVDGAAFPYICVGSYYEECIPFEGNEHLLGTTDAPEEKPEEEEFKFGDKVKYCTGDGEWVDGLFVKKDDDDSLPYLVFLPEENDIEWCCRKDLRHA